MLDALVVSGRRSPTDRQVEFFDLRHGGAGMRIRHVQQPAHRLSSPVGAAILPLR
jgi:hypothetical protein